MRTNSFSRTGLAIFAVAGLLVLGLWIAIASVLRTSERDVVERADVAGANIARSMAEHLATSVRAIDLVLLHLRDDWVASNLPFPDQVARYQEHLKRENVTQVIITSADGLVAYSSLPGFQGVDVADQPFFLIHKDGARELQIGAPLIDTASKQLTIKFTRPIYDGLNRFAGVIALLLPPPGLARIYEDIDLGAGNVVSLVRADGQLLARAHDLAVVSDLSLKGITGLRPGDPPVGAYRTQARIDGVDRMFNYNKVPGYPLYVYVGQAIDTVTAPYRAQRASYLTGGAVATTLLLVVALLLALRQRDKEKERRERQRLEANLRESEAKLRMIAENIDEFVWARDLKHPKRSYVSPVYRRIWGLAPESLQKNPSSFADAAHPDDRAQALGVFEDSIRALKSYDREYRIIRPDGALRWLWSRGYPVSDENGEVSHYVGMVQDITERKLAQQALQEQVAHLQLIYDTSSAAIFDVDTRGVITHANRRMAAMFGHTMESMIGSAYPLHVHPDEREAGTEGMFALMRGGMETLDFARHYVRKDGSGFWGRITGKRMFGANGEVIGLVGVIVDITETRRIEDALRHNERRLREVLDGFPIAVGYVDRNERITYANRIYCETFGDDYQGRSVRDYAGEQAYAAIKPFIDQALAGKTVEIERALVGADGQLRAGMLRYFPDYDADGTVCGYFVFREDITARRKAEEQIRSLNADLERRVRERTNELSAANVALHTEVKERRLAEEAALDLAQRLQRMARRLGEAQEFERRRLAAELHDGVGSHLAAIGLNLALMQKQLPQGDIVSLQRQMSDLIALIDLAKENAKEISVDLRPLLLEDRDLFSALEEYAHKFGNSTGIVVQMNGASSRGRMPADQKIALFRIAQEALNNCAKHAHAKNVAIEFNNHADHLLLSVADDGVGIDLVEVNATKPGLGLVTMQERAEAIGGRWRIESTPGKGTRVTVSVGAALA